MEDEDDGQGRFRPQWTKEPHIEDGVYLPLDEERRSPYQQTVPQRILDIAQATYSGIHEINPPPSRPISPLAWIPRRHGGGFRFGRSEDNEFLELLELPKEVKPISFADFQLFPRLPVELRDMIWRHALPGPRLVELLYDEDIGACTSRAPLPIGLWVCKESRREAKIFYRLLFATARAEATIYLDPHIDEVYLGVGNFHPGPRSVLDLFLSLDPQDVGQIENLAIDSDIANYHETDEQAPTWGLWWTLAVTNNASTDKYVFTSLRRLTIHRNSSHRSSNDSSYIGFHGDILLAEVESNLGEFQAWEMKISGSYWKRKTKVQPVPWKLPLHGGVSWEVAFSTLWSDLENHKYEIEVEKRMDTNTNMVTGQVTERPAMVLKTVRFVSFGKGPDHWADRLNFLTGKKYVQSTGCVYKVHKTLETLLDWREADNDGNGWYGYLTAQLSEHEFDPIHVYLAQTSCDCPIGHVHKAGFYDEEDLEGVDLRKVLVTVEAENKGGRPPWG